MSEQGLAKIVEGRKQRRCGHVVERTPKGKHPSCASGSQLTLDVGAAFQPVRLHAAQKPSVVGHRGLGNERGAPEGAPIDLFGIHVDFQIRSCRQQHGSGGRCAIQVVPPLQDGVDHQGFRTQVDFAGGGRAADEIWPSQ